MVAEVVFLDALSEVDGGRGGFADGRGYSGGGGDQRGIGLLRFIVVREGVGGDVAEGRGGRGRGVGGVGVEGFERGKSGWWFGRRRVGGEKEEGGTWKGLVGGGVWRGERELGSYCREKHCSVAGGSGTTEAECG